MDFVVNNLTYTTLTGNTVSVSKDYEATYSALVIPSSVTYEGVTYNVTEIGDYGFNAITSITSLTIGSNVTKIGQFAFYGCTGITSLSLPNSI